MIDDESVDDSILIRLPCGCVCMLFEVETFKQGAICPWCAATFRTVDLNEFYGDDPDQVVVGRGPLPLFNLDNGLVEGVGRCGDCGCPMVRRSIGEGRYHLDLPVGDFMSRLLKN